MNTETHTVLLRDNKNEFRSIVHYFLKNCKINGQIFGRFLFYLYLCTRK